MIRIEDLNYYIAGNPILEDIQLEITDQEFVAIIGPNGAGKSTLIKLILGLLPLQDGKIWIDDIPHLEWLSAHPMGYLPQREEYDRRFPANALDIVMLGLAAETKLGRSFTSQQRERGIEAMHTTGCIDQAFKPIGGLSGGEMQRVLLARAIVGGSKYLILDEPESSVDQPGVQDFFALLKELNMQGRTIITVSHDLHTVSAYCNFIVCLNRRLHCHNQAEMVNAELIQKTFGKAVRLIDKGY
ncbi:MAG: metal ABC transporter ATP-binding protein [Candidatus Cloacimonetes bacterium]|nr:metal ABC transporter ATP-binding protein [Candidatus Cloacimonadota bacterium]NLO11054.1 metal ABC transporter ATP-binding protein [Candidatus Cloacimonadota bacterium]